jgi:hypothetical protein
MRVDDLTSDTFEVHLFEPNPRITCAVFAALTQNVTCIEALQRLLGRTAWFRRQIDEGEVLADQLVNEFARRIVEI